MANDSGLFKMPEDLQPEVVDLLNHLQSTGTGVTKLRTLGELAEKARGPEEFLASAKLAVTEGTWNKIEKYVKTAIGAKGTTQVTNDGPVKPLEASLEPSKQVEGSKAPSDDKGLGNVSSGHRSGHRR